MCLSYQYGYLRCIYGKAESGRLFKFRWFTVLLDYVHGNESRNYETSNKTQVKAIPDTMKLPRGPRMLNADQSSQSNALQSGCCITTYPYVIIPSLSEILRPSLFLVQTPASWVALKFGDIITASDSLRWQP
jgi:hypothetical protein